MNIITKAGSVALGVHTAGEPYQESLDREMCTFTDSTTENESRPRQNTTGNIHNRIMVKLMTDSLRPIH